MATAGRWGTIDVPPLVGRAAELSLLRDVVLGPERRAAVIAGPPGVGKTRLAEEVLADAARAGFRTETIAATRAAATIPLAALAPLLGNTRIDVDRPGLLPLVQQALSAFAAEERLLLAVDDAHLLDDASAAVIHQLARSRRMRMLLTVRSGEGGPEAITALWKDDLAPWVELAALGESETEELVSLVLGGPIEGTTRRRIWEVTEGNGLYLRELLRGALDAGILVADGGLWHLTAPLAPTRRLSELVAGTLAGVAPSERTALELLALGEPLSLALLQRLTATDAAEQLERRGLVAVRQDGDRTEVRLAHPIYAEVLRRNLSQLAADRLRLQLADTFDGLGLRRRADLLRVAAWRLDAREQLPAELAVRAGRIALADGDPTLARRMATPAWEARDPEAGLLLAEVLDLQGRPRDAVAVLAELQRIVGPPTTAAMTLPGLVVVLHARVLFWSMNAPANARGLVVEALDGVPAGPCRDELTALLGTFDILQGRPRDALAKGEPLLASGKGRVLAEAAIASAPAMVVTGRTSEAAATAQRALAEHQALGDQVAMSVPGIHVVSLVFSLSEHGDLFRAETIAHAAFEHALRLQAPDGQIWFSLMLGRIALMRGRVQTAARWFDEGALVGARRGRDGLRRWCLAAAGLARALQGDDAGAETSMRSALGLQSAVTMMEPEVRRAAAWVRVARGDHAGALRELRTSVDLASSTGAELLEAASLHDLARLDDAAAVTARLDELADRHGAPLLAARATDVRARAIADAAGRAVALEAVHQQYAALGADLLAAEAAGACAAAHRAAGDARAAQRARRVSARLATACEGAVTPDLELSRTGLELTPREREIALLAADGVTSRDIATKLFLSVRTVDNHLARVYEKFGVKGRGDLAAHRADLLE